MNKIFMLMVAIATMWCVSCSKDDEKDLLNGEGGEGVITMVVKTNQIEKLWISSFKEGEIITIDWGDGIVEEFKTYYDSKDEDYAYWTNALEHSYSNSNPHTINIKGSIKQLDCRGNNLTVLDVSKCTALTDLNCRGNNLTSLDVSRCTALTQLDCSYNRSLISLNVSGCTALTKLFCSDMHLTSLNVSGCSKLTYLLCQDAGLTSIDISGCTALIRLVCNRNNLFASALNKIFTDLPTHVPNDTDEPRYIRIGNTSGEHDCDPSIAINKGWNVFYW